MLVTGRKREIEKREGEENGREGGIRSEREEERDREEGGRGVL